MRYIVAISCFCRCSSIVTEAMMIAVDWFRASISASIFLAAESAAIRSWELNRAYGSGALFACRHCYDLAHASQYEAVNRRGLGNARKIRIQLGGSPNILEEFPDKPKGMHWQTYEQLRESHDLAAARSMTGLIRFSDRLQRAGIALEW
jgi:glycine/D-amino acid oxidase-like deaminating enzyme